MQQTVGSSPTVSISDQETTWTLHKSLEEKDSSALKDMLLDEEALQQCIVSRGNLSGVGEDSVSAGILKANPSLTTRWILEILKVMMKWGKCPSLWKTARVIFLYKKGALDDAGNWRPISLTSMVYRVITAHIARCVMRLHQSCPFISPNQKGFVPGTNGCAEHASKLNELLMIANAEHRSIYVAAIDFKDAFGSVPHKLIF